MPRGRKRHKTSALAYKLKAPRCPEGTGKRQGRYLAERKTGASHRLQAALAQCAGSGQVMREYARLGVLRPRKLLFGAVLA